MEKELTVKNLQGRVYNNLEDVRETLMASDEDCVIFDMTRKTLEELDKIKLEDVIFHIDSEYFGEEYSRPIFEHLKMFKKESLYPTDL